MKTTSFFNVAAAVVLLRLANVDASTSAAAPRITASAREFFIFDTTPTGSLEASIVAYNRENATYHVACPTANAACQKEGYWPATVTHIEGSSWIGTNTATAGIEKQWRCRLGRSGGEQEIPDQYGRCFVTTVDAAGSRTVDPGMPVKTCFLEAHSVVVAITAGLEKVEAVHPIITEYEYDPSAVLSRWAARKTTAACATLTSLAPYIGSVSWRPTTWASRTASLTKETGSVMGMETKSGTESVTVTEAGAASDSTSASASASTPAPASGSGRPLRDFSLILGAVALGLIAIM
ncbi:hypothetical protein CTA2_2033 [Colletotrichum tanaceti]|uniref:Secreted protein n=1 Tax=Colletotrichum tanaceti TaxID=1306861 RepID=A0A4U6XQ52_9PEZI|nr:hypothetical protein CTA2_2033 [Colletotrichum tanaceti]TKW57898.1 hypothetical protein CTA1_8373 [Colletotrichum tanaceti]